MQKFLSYILAGTLLIEALVMPASVLAQTTTSTASVDAMIAQLEAQINTLKTQVEALRLARSQVASTSAATLTLIRQLREGMSGDDVRLLQILLAADSDTFPEGLITGYYGKATERAIRRFQKKNGLNQVGRVGPMTMERLLKLIKDNNLSEEDDDDDDDRNNNGRGKRICAKVTSEWTIPEGWTRKHPEKDRKNFIQVCKIRPAPPGNPAPTPTPPPAADTAAPVISGLTSTSTTASATTIKWTTDEFSASTVWYGTTTPPMAMTGSNVTTKNHSINLFGLMASTTYNYKVVAKDAAGNISTSTQQSFTTQ